ncbi:MAG TPA: response regulator [Candidatus Methylomirabilis sp.]|nr:response regulator [Candidatus Methylomirabilis sp.]HSC70582.1 response regulator [Candidatus Methylomirabilis sp.]
MTDCGSVPRRLLLIDDDPSLRTTVGCLLRKFGHTVEVAESGSAGLALLRQKPVDLVLTDLKMPGLTGWDVARLVKATHPRLPVVLVTGCAQTIPPDQPERSWVDAILAKPCGAAAMLAVIGALTRDLADASCSGGPEKLVRTTVRGRPMGAPAAGDVEEAPVDVHGPSMPRYLPGAELA